MTKNFEFVFGNCGNRMALISRNQHNAAVSRLDFDRYVEQ